MFMIIISKGTFRVELFQIINQSHDSNQDLPDSKAPCYLTSLGDYAKRKSCDSQAHGYLSH